MTKNNNIPEKIYKKLLKHAPRVCVDLVIVNGNKFLLGKRKIHAAKGLWFFIGGKILKGETKEKTAERKLREELSIRSKPLSIKFLGIEDLFFKTDKNTSHDVNIVFLVKIKETEFKDFDKKQHSKLAWFNKINPNWHPYIKKMLKSAGFK